MEDREGFEIDLARLGMDAGYRREQARVLLSRAGDVDHVELRRVARRLFPKLGRPTASTELAQLIGAASTMQRTIEMTAITRQREERRRREEAVEDPPLRLDYPAQYGDLDDGHRNLLIRFCSEHVETGAEGRDALSALKARHGWPYSDRTFYVGPWKAARLRRRKRQRRQAEREHANGAAGVADEYHDEGAENEDGDGMASVLDEGGVLLTNSRARYQARRTDDGEWEVQVRGRLDQQQMLRLHREAIDLFFRSARVTNGSR